MLKKFQHRSLRCSGRSSFWLNWTVFIFIKYYCFLDKYHVSILVGFMLISNQHAHKCVLIEIKTIDYFSKKVLWYIFENTLLNLVCCLCIWEHLTWFFILRRRYNLEYCYSESSFQFFTCFIICFSKTTWNFVDQKFLVSFNRNKHFI